MFFVRRLSLALRHLHGTAVLFVECLAIQLHVHVVLRLHHARYSFPMTLLLMEAKCLNRIPIILTDGRVEVVACFQSVTRLEAAPYREIFRKGVLEACS